MSLMRKRLRALAGMGMRKKPEVAPTPADVVHEENKWKLLRYRPRPEGTRFRTPVLMIPSLINKHYVLDLAKGMSFVEWLVAQGHDVFIVDWGTPGAEDRYLGFDDIIDGYIGRALRRSAEVAGVNKVHGLGYCMGGTMLAVHAAAGTERLASFTALAAPIAFQDEGLLSQWTNAPNFEVGELVDAFGNVPWQLMQASFQMLRPTLPLAKLIHMVDMSWNDEYLEGHIALETWANDNVSLPGEFYRRYITDLYQGDELVRGTLHLGGREAKLSNITCPTHVVSFRHDNIVPEPSAAPLADLVGADDVLHTHMNGGHVGAVVSRKASQRLWPKLATWWQQRDHAVPVLPAPTPVRAVELSPVRAPRRVSTVEARGQIRPPAEDNATPVRVDSERASKLH